jgi:fructokinase
MDLAENTYTVTCYGEILWDVLSDRAVPGGAPMNVAYHLKKLGVNPALITKIGHDDDGKKLIQLMERNGISTEFFQMDFELNTGRAYAIAGDNNEVLYDFKKPAAWDNIRWSDHLEKLISTSDYFVFGSLVTRSKESRNTLFELLQHAKYKILDINLRPPHFSRSIIEKLLENIQLLKLNLSELELITGWFSNYRNENDRIKSIQDKFQISNIVVTKGGDGSIFNTNGNFYVHDGFTVELADTIGSGDAFLAGLISKLNSGASPAEGLEFASALGALIATHNGPCPDYNVEDIQELIIA